MLAPECQRPILRLVQKDGKVRVADAASRLGASIPTIRRACAELAAQGPRLQVIFSK